VNTHFAFGMISRTDVGGSGISHRRAAARPMNFQHRVRNVFDGGFELNFEPRPYEGQSRFDIGLWNLIRDYRAVGRAEG
jgi:hypothetical protein